MDTGEGQPLLQGQREAGEGLGKLQKSLRLGRKDWKTSWGLFCFLGGTGGKLIF